MRCALGFAWSFGAWISICIAPRKSDTTFLGSECSAAKRCEEFAHLITTRLRSNLEGTQGGARRASRGPSDYSAALHEAASQIHHLALHRLVDLVDFLRWLEGQHGRATATLVG
jgi:hypothetical protein